MSINHGITASQLGLHVGRGKMLFAVAVERGWARIPDVLYFAARTLEDLRVELVRGVLTCLPKGSKIVAIGPAIGYWHDEQGDSLEAN